MCEWSMKRLSLSSSSLRRQRDRGREGKFLLTMWRYSIIPPALDRLHSVHLNLISLNCLINWGQEWPRHRRWPQYFGRTSSHLAARRRLQLMWPKCRFRLPLTARVRTPSVGIRVNCFTVRLFGSLPSPSWQLFYIFYIHFWRAGRPYTTYTTQLATLL